MSEGRCGKITEQEMRGANKAIQKYETYNKYGDASRRIESAALEEHASFLRTLANKIRKGVVVIDGRCVYTSKRKHVKYGYEKQTHTLT